MYAVLSFIGALLMLLALAGIALFIFLKRNPDVRTFQDFVARVTGVSERPPDSVLQNRIAASDQVGLDAPMGDRLQATEAQQAMTLEGTEQTVEASVTWSEYWQVSEGSGPFVPKPRGLSLKMLVLDRNVIFKLRSREGGRPIWLKSKRVVEMKLMTFFIGAKNGPAGPARRFRNNGQETPEPFQYPGTSGCPAGIWSITDIGRLKAERVTGRTDYVTEDDFFPFVLSREGTDGSFGGGWCVYLDQRPELAQGTGGLFVCQEFVPDQEVEALL
jgi:hypothetical protein